MNQKSKNILLSSVEDFSPHIHTSVMTSKLFFPLQPKEWIWIIRLPSKLYSVHPEDDRKSEEYSEHSEKSPDY